VATHVVVGFLYGKSRHVCPIPLVSGPLFLPPLCFLRSGRSRGGFPPHADVGSLSAKGPHRAQLQGRFFRDCANFLRVAYKHADTIFFLVRRSPSDGLYAFRFRICPARQANHGWICQSQYKPLAFQRGVSLEALFFPPPRPFFSVDCGAFARRSSVSSCGILCSPLLFGKRITVHGTELLGNGTANLGELPRPLHASQKNPLSS